MEFTPSFNQNLHHQCALATTCSTVAGWVDVFRFACEKVAFCGCGCLRERHTWLIPVIISSFIKNITHPTFSSRFFPSRQGSGRCGSAPSLLAPVAYKEPFALPNAGLTPSCDLVGVAVPVWALTLIPLKTSLIYSTTNFTNLNI